jgi:DNA polymerase III epsilon subunit-like protein
MITIDEINESFAGCISIDLETTSLSPLHGAAISAGAALFNSEETLYLEAYLRRGGVQITPQALEVNGETDAGLRSRKAEDGYVSEVEMLKQLAEFAIENEATVLIGKNPQFDYDFLLEIYQRNRLSKTDFVFPFSYRKIDWANMIVPLMVLRGQDVNHAALSSDNLSILAGLEEEAKPHNALNGALHNVACVRQIIQLYNNE